jgi:hypothetical protein
MSLISTNKNLIELRIFFDLHREGKFEKAVDVVSRTGLLPFRQDDLNEKESKFKDLDPLLRQTFPDVLSASAECLYEMFRRLKSEYRGIPPEVEDRLKELQMYSRFLFIFAGLVNMPNTCKNHIQNLRSHMI